MVDPKWLFCYNTCIVVKKDSKMTYTLITKQGKVLTFFLKAVAETYQQAYGGVVFTQQILVDVKSKIAV